MIKKKIEVNTNFNEILVNVDSTLEVFKTTIKRLTRANQDLYIVIREYGETTEHNKHKVNRALESIETNKQLIIRIKKLIREYKVEKKYSLSEVLATYENGFKGDFKRISDNKTVKMVNESIYLGGSVLKSSYINRTSLFVKIGKEASPIEAVQALMNGQTIIAIDGSGKLVERYSKGDYIDTWEFEEYKWYID